MVKMHDKPSRPQCLPVTVHLDLLLSTAYLVQNKRGRAVTQWYEHMLSMQNIINRK